MIPRTIDTALDVIDRTMPKPHGLSHQFVNNTRVLDSGLFDCPSLCERLSCHSLGTGGARNPEEKETIYS